LFDTLVNQILEDQVAPTSPLDVTPKDLAQWKKIATWDALQGIPYGESFCNHFAVRDLRLKFTRDPKTCDRIIQKEYLRHSSRRGPVSGH
jgi:hypothetical protein